jgi:hypothetical protein
LEGIVATVVLGNHAQAGRTAVHGVQLEIVRKGFYHFKAIILQSFSVSYLRHESR